MISLDAKLEALLFLKTEPLSIKKIAEFLDAKDIDVRGAVGILREKLFGRGLTLVEKDDEIMLGTNPETGKLLELIRKEELERDLGKAGLETISIILYQGPVLKNRIDFIRGVNSQFILRNLMVRGMIERVVIPKERGYSYRVTMDLLRYLGLSKIEELPEYTETKILLEKTEQIEEDELPEDNTSLEKTETR